MDDTISRQEAIEALSICNNEYGINCHKCPIRDKRWDGSWLDYDNEIACYEKLMRDSAKLLADAVPVIRCNDCKYWDVFPSSSLAPEFHKCKGLGVHTVANFFCSKGELADG